MVTMMYRVPRTDYIHGLEVRALLPVVQHIERVGEIPIYGCHGQKENYFLPYEILCSGTRLGSEYFDESLTGNTITELPCLHFSTEKVAQTQTSHFPGGRLVSGRDECHVSSELQPALLPEELLHNYTILTSGG